jgi:hypothetical protein
MLRELDHINHTFGSDNNEWSILCGFLIILACWVINLNILGWIIILYGWVRYSLCTISLCYFHDYTCSFSLFMSGTMPQAIGPVNLIR